MSERTSRELEARERLMARQAGQSVSANADSPVATVKNDKSSLGLECVGQKQAINSVVLGILSLFFNSTIVLSLIGVILAAIGLKNASVARKFGGGKGLATAGEIVSKVALFHGLFLLLLLVAIVVIVFMYALSAAAVIY